MRLSKVLTILFHIERCVSAVRSCVPAEEGTEYILITNVLKLGGSSQWHWRRNDDDIGTCDMTISACTTTSQEFKITVEYVANNRFISKLVVHNVSRASPVFAESVWRFVDAQQTDVFVCDLKVYAKWSQPSCSIVVVADGLNMTCLLQNMYPPINCNREVFIDEVEYYKQGELFLSNQAIVPTTPVYYHSICCLYFAKDTLSTGLYRVRLNFGPDFRRFYQHLVHHVTLKRLIDKPIVYVEANYTIEHSGTFRLNCVCKSSGNGEEIKSTIQWYHKKFEGIQTINASVISFKMDESVEDYYCKATNLLEMQSSETMCQSSHSYNTTHCPKFSKYQNVSKELGETATILFCLPSIFKMTEELFIDDHTFVINKSKGSIHIHLAEVNNVQSLTLVVNNLTKHDFRRYVVQIRFISGYGVTSSFTIRQVSEISTQGEANIPLLWPLAGAFGLLFFLLISMSIYCIKVKRCPRGSESQADVKQSHIYSVPSDSHLYMTASRTDTQNDESDYEHYIDIDNLERQFEDRRSDHYITAVSGGSYDEELEENQYISVQHFEYVSPRVSRDFQDGYIVPLDNPSLTSV